MPNERDDAATTKVRLQLPDGFAFVSYEPTPGWKVDVEKGSWPSRSRPTTATRSQGVELITWSSAKGIPAGAFEDFGLSVRVPGKAGDTLTFKAVQTYSNGEVVRWIGAEGSDHPAPTVKLTAARRASAPRPPPRQRRLRTAAAPTASRSPRSSSAGSACSPASAPSRPPAAHARGPSGGSLPGMASTALVRPRHGRVLAGVCAALARRFDVSPTGVRVVFALSMLLPGPQILAYFVLWIVIPSDR